VHIGNEFRGFHDFCPEVSYEIYGYFASALHHYADEIDRDLMHKHLTRERASLSDPKWRWSTATPRHYAECREFSIFSKAELGVGARTRSRRRPQGARIMARIFLCYRRDDSGGYAGRLYDRLGQRFGHDNLFMDIDTIAPGLDFVEAIEKAVGTCDVLLAVIGRQWLTSTDSQGQRRLDNPEDFVRLEIVTALVRQIRVIPVLVGGAIHATLHRATRRVAAPRTPSSASGG
jgi:hypothetical protein